MKQETQGKMKYVGWGLVIGAAITMVIGFGWGGWATASATQKMTEKAVLESRKAICVAQFMADAGSADNLVEFENIDSWNRYQMIEKGGWDKMPGQLESNYGVARACAGGIELLIKK